MTVANATYAKPIFTTASGNTLVINGQVATALASAPADMLDAGIASFDSSAFTVDSNGYVKLVGSEQETATSNIIVYGGGNFASGYKADYTTIQEAIDNASTGDIIFIKEGTYTENLTIDKKLNFVGYDSHVRGSGEFVEITGTHTLSGITQVRFESLTLNSNSATILDNNLASCNVGFVNCRINGAENGITVFARSGAGSNTYFKDCYFRLGATTAKLLNDTASGVTWFDSCFIDGSSSQTASTITAGTLQVWNSTYDVVLSLSSSATLQMTHCDIPRYDTVDNVTWITLAGTSIANISNTFIGSGTATAISVGAGCTVTAIDCEFNSSNTNVIDGAGTFESAGLTFSGTSSHVNATTYTILNEGPSRYIGSTNVGNTNELNVRNLDNTNTSSNALVTVTSGGASGGNASYRACVSGAGCYHWGIDNTDDKLKVSSGDTYLSGNTLLVMDTVGNSTFGFSTAGNTIKLAVENPDNTNSASNAEIKILTETNGGDSYINFTSGGSTYIAGVDNDAGALRITTGTTPSTGNYLMSLGATGGNTWNGYDNGSLTLHRFQNTFNTASSGLCIDARVAGGTAGDAWLRTSVDGVLDWSFGVDNDDSDKWKISKNVTLGTNDYFSITTAGECTMPLQPAFFAYNSANDTNATGAGTQVTVEFDTERFDQNADFNNTTDTFTAPVAGIYRFSAKVTVGAVTSAMTAILTELVTTATTIELDRSNPYAQVDSGGFYSSGGTATVSLLASQTAYIRVTISNGAGDTATIRGGGSNLSYFCGELIC